MGTGHAPSNFGGLLDNDNSNKGTAKQIDIAKFKGKSLEETEGILRNRKREVLVAFDENDQPILAYQGNEKKVAFPSALLKMKNITVTHGHPKGVSDFGGTFSFADVTNMANSNWSEHRATASGRGEMNYIMRKTSKATKAKRNALIKKIDNDKPKIKSAMQAEYKKAYDKVKNNGGSTENAIHAGRQAGVGYLNRYWKETLPKYGFEYVTRKENYKYNR